MSPGDHPRCLYCGEPIDTSVDPSVCVRPDSEDEEQRYAHFGCYADNEIDDDR